MGNLELNHSYLIISKIHVSDNLKSITVLLITEKAYYIQWHNNFNDATTWELKTNFIENYKIVEDISSFGKPSSINVKYNYTYKECSWCYGTGVIHTDKNTSGQMICPYCHGNRIQLVVSEINTGK